MADISNSTSADTATRLRDRRRSSGNIVEWFDFYITRPCAHFAPAFFPSGNTTTQLLTPPACSPRVS